MQKFNELQLVFTNQGTEAGKNIRTSSDVFIIYFQCQPKYQTVTSHQWYWNEECEPYSMKKLGSIFPSLSMSCDALAFICA